MPGIVLESARKDSAQSSKEGVVETAAQVGAVEHNSAVGVQGRIYPNPTTISTHHLSNKIAEAGLHTPGDIVTNPDRAKSPTVTRVLSPQRPRRTPVLVNAPDVKWSLGRRLRHMPSFSSLRSSSTMSTSASTVRLTPTSPRNVALPASAASSLLTVMPEETDPVAIPLPPSPPVSGATTLSPRTRNTIAEVMRPRSRNSYIHHPHFLSPVTEASSGFSRRSISTSIVDLDVESIATAERHNVSEVTRQNVRLQDITSLTTHRSTVSLDSQGSRFVERLDLDGARVYAESLMNREFDGMGRARGSDEKESAYLQKGKRVVKTICARVRKFTAAVKRGAKHAGRKFEKAENLALWKCLRA